MSYVVSIADNNVVIHRDMEDVGTVVKSVTEYNDYFNAEAKRLNRRVDHLEIYNSSTMDFPHDSTSDPAVLALVAALP